MKYGVITQYTSVFIKHLTVARGYADDVSDKALGGL